MKRVLALLAVTTLVLGASGVRAADSTTVEFTFTKGAFCKLGVGSTSVITFLFTGADTDTQGGAIAMECTLGTVPAVTVVETLGNGGGAYDWSANMERAGNPADTIFFTGTWTNKENGLGLGSVIYWDFDATATGLLAAVDGTYSKVLTFEINP